MRAWIDPHQYELEKQRALNQKGHIVDDRQDQKYKAPNIRSQFIVEDEYEEDPRSRWADADDNQLEDDFRSGRFKYGRRKGESISLIDEEPIRESEVSKINDLESVIFDLKQKVESYEKQKENKKMKKATELPKILPSVDEKLIMSLRAEIDELKAAVKSQVRPTDIKTFTKPTPQSKAKEIPLSVDLVKEIGDSLKTISKGFSNDITPKTQTVNGRPVKTAGRKINEAKMTGRNVIETTGPSTYRVYAEDKNGADTHIGYLLALSYRNKLYYVFPKHFLESAGLTYMRNGKLINIDTENIKQHSELDLVWYNVADLGLKSYTVPTMSVNDINNHDLTLKVWRNNKWMASTSKGITYSCDGEYTYSCDSKPGDCGLPVFCGNNVVGIHVGTKGENIKNLFVMADAALTKLSVL